MKLFFLVVSLSLVMKSAAHPGVGIVMDSKKNVFYTDLKQVWKIDSSGKKTIVVKNVHTHELYIDPEDNLFGEHLWYEGEKTNKWGHYVWKYSADGKLKKVIPDTEGFLKNYSFVRDKLGRMYWADRSNKCQKLVRKNPDKSVSIVSDECFSDIDWMTVSSNGTVYLMDGSDLKRIDSSGHSKTLARQLKSGNQKQFHAQPDDPHTVMGLWLDDQENLYAAITGVRVVKKLSPGGTVSEVTRVAAPWSPNGGMMGFDGELWVLESALVNREYKVRVERISKSGKRTIY